MSEDGIIILSAFGIIGILTGLVQWVGGRQPEWRIYLRKTLHLLVILACAAVIQSVESKHLLGWLFIAFSGILALVVKLRFLNISQGKSFGIAFFPLALGILLMVDGLPKSYVVIAAIILAIVDPLAGLIGMRFAKRYWTPLEEMKSWLGSLVFFIVSLVILILVPFIFPESNLAIGFLATLLIVLLATMSEMFSWRGSDNLTIPLVVAVGLQAVAIHGAIDGLLVALVIIILGFALVKLKWLNLAGVVAVVMMATWITLMISPIALILPIIFLAIGSLLSKLNKGIKSLSKDDSDGRNAHQVLANGGIGMIIAVPYLLTHNDNYLVLYAIVFAIAMSDTMSSEIGRYMNGTTWSIGTLNRVAPGESGGISISGTAAGFVGALTIGVLAYFIFELTISGMLMISSLGFFGMIMDSFLGASLQGKYKVHGILLEEGRKDQLVSGYHWIDNSMVNFLSVGMVVLIGYLIL